MPPGKTSDMDIAQKIQWSQHFETVIVRELGENAFHFQASRGARTLNPGSQTTSRVSQIRPSCSNDDAARFTECFSQASPPAVDGSETGMSWPRPRGCTISIKEPGEVSGAVGPIIVSIMAVNPVDERPSTNHEVLRNTHRCFEWAISYNIREGQAVMVL